MNRRTFHSIALGMMAGASRAFPGTAARDGRPYQANWPSLEKHVVPDWYQDAKLGIFVHWGLYSVPAWAPPTGELGKVDDKKWFTDNPYAEWYLNTLRITDSPTYKHHVETYGKDFDYYNFRQTFNRENKQWQPEDWAALFQKTGARYVVLTTKHHDGFRLWPSRVVNPRAGRDKITAERDLVGDLTSAVRSQGMKMGLYYSGGLDWTFTTEPIRSHKELFERVPQSLEYAKYADAHWRELIEHYQPAVMWNDISYPKAGQVPQLFAEYYNTVPDGVINNRLGVDFADFTTPEYAKYDKITQKKWEACRGLGFSFGYNQVEGPEQVIAPDKLIALLVDIVSNNGNLLLNVGPKPNGTISGIQMDRLQKLGKWLSVNGEGIFGSRPWAKASASAPDGTDVRFTKKGDALYVFFLNRPAGNVLAVPGVKAADATRVEILGGPAETHVRQAGQSLAIHVKGGLPESYALGVKITPLPEAIS
ncbi:MAG: alpha-L-fucosidase [Acidobacteriota bacterium]|nr:alpha-L-fucosidase [Acidobacteriota bacterium]